MERVARCLLDASAGKNPKAFTIYSQYPKFRYDACLRME
jgi:hypothetical protein